MTCPQEPVPLGWKVWRGDVPTPLTQLAMDVRDHVRSYAYGSIAKTVQWQGQTVGVFVSHHTWTYRNGQLITGLCIPGCSLVSAVPAGTQGVGGTTPDDLSTPDPTAAVYGADDVALQRTSWGVVALTAAATAAIVAAFAAALHYAGSR